VFFLKVMEACILSSGMSASAFTATVAGCPGTGPIIDHTVFPRLSIGRCGSSEAISIAARAVPGSSELPASGV
jgi:hypothetical protein